ncbi:DNA polymerase III subunit gamma/tau [Roseomonas sp. NAR14]|uniref:DNA polymerase III subunit gamma/tau n=1 Tax=Roseomonas acroporae TaxID=2937791 RepID=A0A9X1Y7Z7_9PROT|nr:DNA polymerase III subunit gamma/tau [Roseomonas acroporae]MCK8783905.1 DNA polymerase III subunit gamma/tau [Roseomonas acroporae]
MASTLHGSDDALNTANPADALPEPPAEGPGLFGDAPAPAATPGSSGGAPPVVPPGVPREAAPAPYRVLARKYRPQTLDDLIGQDTLVRTLRNAFAQGRVAHGFMLTGVRGVGKTTTARIIARALNCVGPDGKGGPTADPCGVCAECVAILADRHPDVQELDAASNNGVDSIRELREAVRYRPARARFKVYILDEVHMLSTQAFNALLKTLEEPPPQVKFVFATTEIRKVPTTILSRCQTFHLRRVPQAALREHFGRIAGLEGAAVEPEALAMIARAADGSVRDGLSLLDQAIALGGDSVSAESVRDMLGLADRALVLDLAESVLTGRLPEALALMGEAHARGADPGVVLADLLELVHTLTRLRAVPALREDQSLPEAERVRGGALAARLSVPALGRAWQMLLKGLGELAEAPDRQAAAEMVLIRLAHVAELPTPGELVRRLAGEGVEPGGAPAGGRGGPVAAGDPGGAAGHARGDAARGPVGMAMVGGGPGGNPEVGPGFGRQGRGSAGMAAPALDIRAAGAVPSGPRTPAPHAPEAVAPGVGIPGGGASVALRAVAGGRMPEPQAQTPPPEAPVRVGSFREAVALAQGRRPRLHGELVHSVHLVQFAPGRIELRVEPQAPRDLAGQFAALLGEATGMRWTVALSNAPGEPTLAEQGRSADLGRREIVASHPLVQAVLAAFPGARIEAVRDAGADYYGLAPAPPEPDGDPAGISDDSDSPDDGGLEFAPPDADRPDDL